MSMPRSLSSARRGRAVSVLLLSGVLALPLLGAGTAVAGVPDGMGPTVATATPAVSTANTDQCNPPNAIPRIPDGGTASEAELRQAHDQMQAYVTQGQAFITCVDTLHTTHRHELTVAQYLRDIRVQDGMVANMRLLADAFNSQLHVFKARTAASGK